MANAKKCDICGAFYAAHKLSRKLRDYNIQDTAAIILFDPDPNSNYVGEVEESREAFETCPVCMRKIKTFIDNMKENLND